MPRKIKVADLFCGAGGTSTAAQQAVETDLGRELDLVCVNSWERAIETHQRMHPTARHFCKQWQAINPREAVPGGRLDLLWGSPTCTSHSRARGGRPTSDQQRLDPDALSIWSKELTCDRIGVENVPEFVKWGPVNPRTGKPIKSKEGLYYNDWVASFDRRGFDYEYRFINFADYGDATTRVRYIGQFRRRALGRRGIRWPHPTHARDPGRDLFGGLQKWRAARECIDWSHRGTSIYSRPRPLSPKTLLRIYAGIVKFGWPERYVIRLRRYLEARGIAVPSARVVRSNLARPVEAFVLSQHANGRLRSVDEPVPGIVTVNRTQLVEPGEPFVLAQGEGSEGRPVGRPLPTIPCGGAHALIAPYYGSGSGLTAKSVDDPLDTIPTVDRFGLIVPVTHGGGLGRAYSPEGPFPTFTTANRGELAFITSAFGERDGQLPRIRPIDIPVPTIAAQGYVPLVDAGDDDDLLYRMLQPPELARATSFPDDYQFAGNKTEVTRQIGNAMPIKGTRAVIASMLWDMAA
jgi:DNA (cytosine-5)-methyltransferase 1